MIDVFDKYQAPVIATMQVDGEAISRFGVIDADEVEPNVFKIRDMVEKPKFADAPSDLAIIGRYYFHTGYFFGDRKNEAWFGRRDPDHGCYADLAQRKAVLRSKA
jgi:UTP-glucose-1-phosphate uridylyltransferase